MMDPRALDGVETPRLLLDADRLDCNAARMRARCAALGVALRPHFKTAKSLDVARIASGGTQGPATVSTLAEAESLAAAGWRDILYATAMAPAKLARVARLQRETEAVVRLSVDSPEAARLIGVAAAALDARFSVLIEIDSGEHRSGIEPASPDLAAIADALASVAPHLRLDGVLTHAGHSYAEDDPAALRAVAESERAAAVASAQWLRAAGYPCPIVSVGSSPTAMFADHLEGVTEVRAGIYLFWDLAQASRGICSVDDIAVSVLATVIGHQRRGPGLVIDAGALALSKDISANRFLPDTGYGWVCDPVTLRRIGALSVATVHQEHGGVPVPDATWFARHPIGSLVRILPNHACLTCAGYDAYDVLRGGAVSGQWARTNGW